MNKARFAAWPFLSLAAASALVYLGASRAGGFMGFPLDDAWIHQTYARNLALRGEFAFWPGQPSAGSTAPLWSALIALGVRLGLEPRVWTYLLGALSLAVTAGLAYRLVLQWWPERQTAAVVAAVGVALEWHLAWAAVSGMETALFAALILAVLVIPERHSVWLGLMVGLSVFVRPDGLTMLPFVFLRGWLGLPERRWRWAAAYLISFAGVFLLYLGFNEWTGGALWPNTFFAKQAEYAVLRDLPLLQRAFNVSLQPLIGAQMLLVPGLVAAGWRSLRLRHWPPVIGLLWVISFLGLYSLRLPVTYQYGRYVIPVIPVVIVSGVGGMSGLLRLTAARLGPRLVSRVWAVAFSVLGLIFWGQGAWLYQRDVRIIETEMVATARWVQAHTAPNAVIAAHDIGALGYFGGRPILDLAGLVSPQVIPFIRDEDKLRAWLTAAHADYLVTFPGWYPRLTGPLAGQVVFQTRGQASPAAGGENMTVYRWP